MQLLELKNENFPCKDPQIAVEFNADDQFGSPSPDF